MVKCRGGDIVVRCRGGDRGVSAGLQIEGVRCRGGDWEVLIFKSCPNN